MHYRTLPIALLWLALLSAAVRPDAENPPRAQDERLEGRWEAVSFIRDGKGERQKPGNIFLTIRGRVLTLKVGEEMWKATIKAEVGRTPHAIDITYESGPDKGKTVRGVYEVRGDELRICHGDAAKQRPTEIASKKGSGYSVGVWKRLKK
jgi:uncharacterized protein (TIGR03067 family)